MPHDAETADGAQCLPDPWLREPPRPPGRGGLSRSVSRYTSTKRVRRPSEAHGLSCTNPLHRCQFAALAWGVGLAYRKSPGSRQGRRPGSLAAIVGEFSENTREISAKRLINLCSATTVKARG